MDLESFLSQWVVIAVTGHRDLLAEDEPLLKKRVRERLDAISSPANGKVLVTALAPGADQFVAEVALALGIPLCVVLPMTEADYEQVSFEGEQAAFNRLPGFLAKAAFVYRLQEAPAATQTKDASEQAKLRQAWLEKHALLLAQYADHIVALWDGLDNGKPGGPSHIVRMARSGRDDAGKPLKRLVRRRWNGQRPYNGRLHHLITRRQSNPFPTGYPGDATPGRSTDRTWPYGTTRRAKDCWVNHPYGHDATWQTAMLPRYVPHLSGWQRFMRLLNANHEAVLRYGVPAALFLLTLIVGVYGYWNQRVFQDGEKGIGWWGNVLFKAADLAAPDTTLEYQQPDCWLQVARWTGAGFVFWAAVVNLLFVFGDAGIRWYLRIFWKPVYTFLRIPVYRIWRFFAPPGMQKPSPRQRFNLICGLTEASYDLFLDLQSKGERVLILDREADKSPYKADCINRGGIVLNKDPLSERVLADFFVWEAKRVFATTASDTDNLRIAQQAYNLLDQHALPAWLHLDREWFVQASDVRIRDLLFQSIRVEKHPAVTVHTFDVYENIARRQLHDYPLDRFHLAPDRLKTSCLVVVGFGLMAEKLVLQALRIGFYDQDRRLRIRVYTDNAAAARRRFVARYPVLKKSRHEPRLDPVRNEVFAGDETAVFDLNKLVCFEELDGLMTDLAFDGNLLARDLGPALSTSLYVCLNDGLESVGLLRELLPRLVPKLHDAVRQKLDFQVFAFYNFPNQEEEYAVEAQLNRAFPTVPITFFGNFLEACSETVICQNAIDNLPELIHWNYSNNFEQWQGDTASDTDLKRKLKRLWRDVRESDRESSRLAADHLWVKYRLALAWFRQRQPDPLMAQDAFEGWLGELQKQTDQEIAAQEADRQLPKEKRTAIPPIPWAGFPPVEALADVEHRRWSAEKLLAGVLPLMLPADYTDEAKLTELVRRWNDKTSSFKKEQKDQRLHLDLVPTSVLNRYQTTGEAFRHQEKYKDIQQVCGIPLFIGKLSELNMSNLHF